MRVTLKLTGLLALVIVLVIGAETWFRVRRDVAVFQAAVRLRDSGECLAYSLGVRSEGTPQEVLAGADFLIDEVAGVESFLAWLLKARMASST